LRFFPAHPFSVALFSCSSVFGCAFFLFAVFSLWPLLFHRCLSYKVPDVCLPDLWRIPSERCHMRSYGRASESVIYCRCSQTSHCTLYCRNFALRI
jgi:hypothetical protein